MKIKKFFGYWVPVFIWAGLIFYLSHIPGLKSGFDAWDFLLRKCAHVFEYFVLTSLLLRAWLQAGGLKSKRSALYLAGLLALLYAGSDEFHQSFVPERGPSVVDVAIDGVGIMLALLLYRFPKVKTFFETK